MTLRAPAFLSARPVRIAALVYAVCALACTQVPLLNYLGYEFSALTALLASVCAGIVTIALVRSAPSVRDHDPEKRITSATTVLSRSAAANTALLVIPLLIGTGNALFVRNCSLAEGAAFFLLLPCVSALFGTGLGYFCAVHYTHPRLLLLTFCALLLCYSAAIGYLTPALFSYNLLYGYFPGLTYDEVLPLTGTLVLFRLLTLLVAAALAWVGTIIVADGNPGDSTTVRGLRLVAGLVGPGRRLRTAGIVLALSAFYGFRCELGFESTEGFIQRSLGGEYRTKHFTIYYAPASFTEAEIRRVGAEHEFRLSQVQAALALPHAEPVTSYVYPSPEAKQRFIGAGNTDVTKPWSGQIHLSKQSFDGSLKHELVHAAAAPFGLPIIRASASMGIVEGLAMALDGEGGNRTLHEYAAALRASGVAPDIRRIMSFWGFASQHSSVSYVLAGSFCKYLIDRYGIRKMTRLYRSADYGEVYGRTIAQLVTEWNGFLARVPVESVDSDRVDALFRRPAIFAKVCPRVLARQNVLARAAFARRDFGAAESLYADSYAQGHGYEALAGWLASALRLGKYAAVTAALDSIILQDERPARYLPLFIGIGDAYWMSGNSERAFALYDRVYHADISEGHTEASGVRILALNADPEGMRYARLFHADAGDSARVAAIDSSLRVKEDVPWLLYLKGRIMMRLGEYAGALATLRQANLEDLDSQLEAIRLRSVGQALFRLGRYEEARRYFWTSLNAADAEAAEIVVNTWIDRCEWMRAHAE